MNPSATKAIVELVNGPQDGHVGEELIIVPAGKFALYVHRVNQLRYVYQAARFIEDCPEGEPLRMDFIQIIDEDDEL